MVFEGFFKGSEKALLRGEERKGCKGSPDLKFDPCCRCCFGRELYTMDRDAATAHAYP